MDRQFSLSGSLTRRRRPEERGETLVLQPDSNVVFLDKTTISLPPAAVPAPEVPTSTMDEWFYPTTETPPQNVVLTANDDILPTPIFAGTTRLTEYAQTGAGGMTVKFDIIGIPSTEPHPFRGIKVGASNGQRVKLMVCTAADDAHPEIKPVYNGEAIVSWWTEDARGVHVKFKLDDGIDGYDTHPFAEYNVGDDGQLMTMMCWPITEAEVIVEAKPKTTFNRMSAVTQSQILCKNDDDFHAFCFSIAESLGVYADPEMEPSLLAAEVIYAYCGIESRAKFKESEEARAKWNTLLQMFRSRRRR
jgi:hypothetical protein